MHDVDSPSAVLPRRLRLPPHRSLLLRGPSARLLGLDPRTALVVDDLPPPLARMLDELAVAGGAGRPGGPGRAARARIATRPRSCCGGWSTPTCSSTRTSPTGSPGSARRRPSSSSAADGSRPGSPAGLALAGVGSVWIEADADGAGAGGRSRHGPARRRPRPVGRRRRSWTSSGGSHRARAPGRHRPGPRRTCACSPTPSSPNRHALAALHRDRIAHLPVRLRDGTGIVGPLVLPGRSACLGLRRAAPVRPRSRLAGRHGPARRATRPRQMPPTAAATAALGVAQVLAALDVAAAAGRAAPPVLGATLETRSRLGRAAAPPVAGAPGLQVWRTTVRADMRAARRTGDNHEVMSAARPSK